MIYFKQSRCRSCCCGEVDMKKTGRMILRMTVITIAAAAVLAGAFIFMQNAKPSHYVPYTGDIVSVSWSSFGGMEGGFTDYNAVNTDRGYVSVTKESRVGPSGKAGKKTYRTDPEILRDLEELFKKHGVREWGELPDSELIALDAPTVSVSIELSGGESFTFSSYKEFPDGSGGFLYDVRKIFEQYCER